MQAKNPLKNKNVKLFLICIINNKNHYICLKLIHLKFKLMITVSFTLHGSHIVKGFASLSHWHNYYDEINPFDSPYIIEVLSIANNEV